MINPEIFPIGTIFRTYHLFPKYYIGTVVNILKTYNNKNELIKIEYICSEERLDYIIINRKVTYEEIKAGLIIT